MQHQRFFVKEFVILIKLMFGLGVLLHVIVTGTWPYRPGSQETLEKNIIFGKTSFHTSLDNDSVLLSLLSSMLCVDAEKRFSVKDILDHGWMKPEVRKWKEASSVEVTEVIPMSPRKRGDSNTTEIGFVRQEKLPTATSSKKSFFNGKHKSFLDKLRKKTKLPFR